MKKITSTILALAAAVSVQAAVVDFTYNIAGDTPSRWGYDKKETVNVAIRINESALVGSKITGMSVPVFVDLEATTLGQCTAFITTELKVESKVNVANVCTENATLANGVLSCTFSEPYTITEEGVYVGYTIPIEAFSMSLGCKPIAVVSGKNPDGLYIASSRSVLKWSSKSADLGAVSAMSVTMEGDFRADAAGVALEPKLAAVSGKSNEIMVKFSNYGTNPLTTVEYVYTVGDKTGSGSKTFTPAIDPIFGAYVTTSISIDAPEQSGTYPLEVTVTKANGVDCPQAVGKSSLVVAPFIAVNRPLVEEFTGLWCGWCPRGYAALESLHEANPDRFVAIAYHNNDPMATIGAYPVNVSGFPHANINRVRGIDPGNLPSQWPAFAAETANSAVDVELSWADEAHTILRAATTVHFTEAQEGKNFRIGACLVEDDMTDETWGQSNYYSGKSATGDPWLDIFTAGRPVVYGLPFNDVVISFPNSFGDATIMPEKIDAFGAVTYVEEFDLNTPRNLSTIRVNPIQDVNKLRVVGILFDAAGRPLNCNTSAYATEGGQIDPVYVNSPIIRSYTPATAGNPAEMVFTCPALYDGDVKIQSDRLLYSILVDGKEYEFDPAKYQSLTQATTTMSYEYSDTKVPFDFIYNEEANTQTVKIFAENPKTIGVKTIYQMSSVLTYDSRVVTIPGNEAYEGAEDGIFAVEGSAAEVSSVRVYDLQGREISNAQPGQIVIRRMQMTDGTVRTAKIRN